MISLLVKVHFRVVDGQWKWSFRPSDSPLRLMSMRDAANYCTERNVREGRA